MTTSINYPFQNIELPLEDRVNDLVARFTLDEKVNLMIQYQTAVERLGVKAYKHGTEAAHGMAWLGEATGYPQPIGLGCTWDTELMKKIGSAIGDEARGFYKRNPEINGLTLWAPTVDMERDPRWGRTEEAYGEDPVLAGKLASALVQGMQGDHPKYLKSVATLKHFIANNNEVGRGDASVSIDPRNMREYYLKAFEIPFKEGGAQSMMTAYNAINGVPANLSPDVKAIVKEEWGMDGFVVSDAFDVSGTVRDHGYLETHKEAVARSVRDGGIDSLTDDGELMKQSLREALAEGLLAENDLDVALRNTFRVRFRLGEFDPESENPYAAIDESIIMHPDHEKLSREATGKAVVLLKNDKNILPLQANKVKKIAVIGPLGGTVYRDWYSGTLPYAVTPLQGIQEKLHSYGGTTIFAGGTDRVKLKAKKNGRYVQAQQDEHAMLSAIGEHSEAAEVFEVTDWGWDSHTIIAESNGRYLTTDDRVIKASATQIWEWFTKEVMLVRQAAEGSKDIALSTWNDIPVTVKNNTGDLLVGSGAAEETANEINVSGAASVTTNEAEKVTADVFEIETVTDKYEAARAAASEAEVAIVFVGNHPLINGKETIDRPDITLPQSQEQLIKEVMAVNPNTVVVVIGSYPYALNWVDENVPAVLYSTHAGQELGNAIADVLFGDVNPAGRLNMTWYKSVAQLPEFMDYDIIKGERTYQYFKGEALYPFGHGLSYTSFQYDDISVERGKLQAGQDTAFTIKVKLTNAGEIAGEEVVQLYGHAQQSRVKRPLKQLLGFKRVALQAGESKEISFLVAASELAIWDVTREQFCIEAGNYSFMVGASSANIALQHVVAVQGEVIPSRNLTTKVKAINYDEYEHAIIGECYEGGSAVEIQGQLGWIAFKGVEFGEAVSRVVIRAASTAAATIEIRLGDSAGAIVGQSELIGQGAQAWQNCSFEVAGIAGQQDIYVVVQGNASLSTIQFQ